MSKVDRRMMHKMRGHRQKIIKVDRRSRFKYHVQKMKKNGKMHNPIQKVTGKIHIPIGKSQLVCYPLDQNQFNSILDVVDTGTKKHKSR